MNILISGLCLGSKARFLSFNRTQSRSLNGLLTGHNTLRKHLHLLGLLDSPLCRRCGAEEQISSHVLCECEAFHSDMRIWAPSSWNQSTLRVYVWVPSGTLVKQQSSHKFIWGTKDPSIKA
jgi:hypothetical protein